MSPHQWSSIERIAPQVTRWRSRETIGYVKKIELFHAQLSEVLPLSK
jgi:hypothetical protein